MKYLRIAWVVLAIIVIGLDFVGATYEYEQVRTVCTVGPCIHSDEALSIRDAADLKKLGISQEFYAGLLVGIQVLGVITFSAVAAVIFLRSSNDRMAMLASFTLLIFGGAAFNSDLTEAFAGAHLVFWYPVNLLDYAGQMAFCIFFFTFPDGRFVPRWTRWLAVLWAVLFIPNTFFPGSSFDILGGPLFVVYVGTLVFVQIYRYARVSSLVQRQQTKWVVYGSSLAIGGFAATLAFSNLFFSNQQNNILGEIVQGTLIYGFILLIPISIGVAILRSRLYDIDFLINRTLVYGVLTITLGFVYVGSVVLLQRIFVALTGQGSQLTIVASTLVIAALFTPLRRRTQDFIDRRFYRKRYNAQQTLAAFSTKLRDETNLDALGNGLVSVERETMQPESVSLWLMPSDKLKER